jgi:protease-4
LADGRVFTGEQALEYKLIDIIGTYDDAIQLAAELGGIKGEPKVYRERPNRLTIIDLLTSDVKSLIYQNLHLWPRMQYLATY